MRKIYNNAMAKALFNFYLGLYPARSWRLYFISTEGKTLAVSKPFSFTPSLRNLSFRCLLSPIKIKETGYVAYSEIATVNVEPKLVRRFSSNQWLGEIIYKGGSLIDLDIIIEIDGDVR